MAYKNKKKTLNNKLIISLVSVILLVVVSIGVTINIVLENTFADYITKNNKKEINSLITSLEEEYKNNQWNIYNIKEIGKISIDKGRIVELYDDKENLVWGAREYDNKMCHQTMDGIKNNMKNMNPKWDGEYSVEKYNLTNEYGDYIGYVNVGSYGAFYYMDEEVDFLNHINKLIVIIAIITIMITVIIAILISNNISKPIEKVSEMTKLIGEGGYTNKIEYNSNIKEIDTLINSINDLESKLEEQEKLRKRLTTDVSHELRTPLTSIQTHLEAILDGVWEPTNDRLSSINEEVIRLTSLVNQLKDLAKFDSDESKLNLTQVNLGQLIQNIIYNNQGKALEKNIEIKSSLEEIESNLDKEKISQLIVNLLSNAIRYTNEGGYIYISSYKKDNVIKIHVKDNGVGIPDESLKYIFERFYRVDESRSKKTGGIGVGLTISKSIVNLHRGSIEVISKVREGTEFIVTIPIIDLKHI